MLRRRGSRCCSAAAAADGRRCCSSCASGSGRTAVQYIDVERTATTPERFLRAVTAVSPFPVTDTLRVRRRTGARAAFDATLAFFGRARTAASEPATFLLDEFLELRTFESFPGLRRVQHDCVDGLSSSGNRFVLTSRYIARALRLLRDRSARFEVIHMPALTAEDTLDILGPTGARAARRATTPTTSRAPSRRSPTAARPTSARSPTSSARCASTADRAAATRSARSPRCSAPDGRLAKQCGFCYELRLHRARGYGALKAILEILGEDEGLTLTEISHRLQRTPGSTKDYLSWLEDVDLVTSRQKRYSFTDPLLRVWVRLHCRPSAPTEDDLAREVHRYALPRLPQTRSRRRPRPRRRASRRSPWPAGPRLGSSRSTRTADLVIG